mgnify:FL=1
MSTMWVLAALVAGTASGQDIVGGSTTDDFPEVGSLAVQMGTDFRSFCSGTLVRSTWVMTAAHCLDSADQLRARGERVVFVVGSSVRDTDIEDYVEVERTIAHPDWGTRWADIGLVELSGRGLEDWPTMRLNEDPYEDFWNDSYVTHVGYGATGDDGRGSGIKRTVDIPVEDGLGDMLVMWDPDHQTNVCNGDSGGAAFRPDDETGELELVGVNAIVFSIEGGEPSCEGPDAANGATRVDLYMDWVLEHIGPEEVDETPAPAEDAIETVDEDGPEVPPAPLKTSTPDQPDPPGACATVSLSSTLWAWLAGLVVVGRRRAGTER